jgi:hypothetical protein
VGFALAEPIVSAPIANSDVSTVQGSNTYGKPNQSRVWYNTHQQRWDGLIPQNDGGGSASDHYILTDVSGSQLFTEVELEDRNTARPDAFWDDASGTLYVLGSHGTLSRFWRVHYDRTADVYGLDPNASAVAVPGIAHQRPNWPGALYVSSNGSVWVAIMREGALDVQHSTDGGTTWMSSPTNLDPDVKGGVTTWIHFERQARTYVGVFACENGDEYESARCYFWYIDQDDDPSIQANWADDSSNIPEPFGSEHADDHVSAGRDAAGNQYFAVKTQDGGPTDPLIRLYRRTASGSWSQHLVTETQEKPEQSRPSLVIDHENGEIRIYTNDTAGGAGNLVRARLDALEELSTAPLVPVFDAADGRFTDLLTPRHGVSARSGVVTVAQNIVDDTLWFSREEIEPFSVSVPDVVGLPRGVAKRTIVEAMLAPGGVVKETSTTVRPGRVVDQHPKPGSQAVPDSVVDLVVSRGPSACDSPTMIAGRFNRRTVPHDPDGSGNYVWFNSVVKLLNRDRRPATLEFTGGRIEFEAEGTEYVLTVPPARVRFDEGAELATTDFIGGRWVTTVPSDYRGDVFLSGLAFRVPAGGLPGGIGPVTWWGNFNTDTPGTRVRWEWAAAVYHDFSAEPEALRVRPIADSRWTLDRGPNPAGTPESYAFEGNLAAGARSGGGSNWTGSAAGSARNVPCSEPRLRSRPSR